MSEQEKLEELERELLEAMRKVSALDESVARQRAIVQASRPTPAAPDAPCWSCKQPMSKHWHNRVGHLVCP